MTREHPDPYLGVTVDIALSHRISVKIMDQNYISVGKASNDTGNLIVIDPGSSRLDRTSFSLFESYDCVFHYSTS